jgi:cell division septation protein DedD
MSDPRQYRDEPLAFDDRRPPARRGPAPVTLIISILLLLGVAGGVAYLYRDGVRGADGPPRPVGAPLRDVRTVAPPSPQAADPAAGLSIYKDDSNSGAAPKFAPPPEEPVARAAETPPTVAPTAAPASAEAPPVKAAAAAPAKAAPAKSMTIDKLIAQADDKTTRGADEPKPAVKAVVQIGAFSSEDLARTAFHDAARIGGGKMSGKAMRLVPIEKDGATLYRVAATGFTSKEDAQAVCDKLKAAGKACFVR